MQVVYDRLFALLKEREIIIKQFREDLNFSGSIITRLQHNGFVTTETIGKICNYLRVQPNDIMTVVFDDISYEEYEKQQKIAELEAELAKLKN